jgi:hypothetical protein
LCQKRVDKEIIGRAKITQTRGSKFDHAALQTLSAFISAELWLRISANFIAVYLFYAGDTRVHSNSRERKGLSGTRARVPNCLMQCGDVFSKNTLSSVVYNRKITSLGWQRVNCETHPSAPCTPAARHSYIQKRSDLRWHNCKGAAAWHGICTTPPNPIIACKITLLSLDVSFKLH